MLLRMAALGEGVIGIALKEELDCGFKVVFGPGTPFEYASVGKDVKGDGCFGAHVSRAGTSVRNLALILLCVSKGDFILVGR